MIEANESMAADFKAYVAAQQEADQSPAKSTIPTGFITQETARSIDLGLRLLNRQLNELLKSSGVSFQGELANFNLPAGPKPNEAPVYRLGQAAKMLGVSRDTIRRWADNGQIGFRRTPGGQRVFSQSDIGSILNGGTKE
jgi:excisionase family DNA binding protein